MIKAGIVSWDYLIIRHQTDVEDWDIWVLIQKDDFDEYATLKQIFHTPSWVLAKPKILYLRHLFYLMKKQK